MAYSQSTACLDGRQENLWMVSERWGEVDAQVQSLSVAEVLVASFHVYAACRLWLSRRLVDGKSAVVWQSAFAKALADSLLLDFC